MNKIKFPQSFHESVPLVSCRALLKHSKLMIFSIDGGTGRSLCLAGIDCYRRPLFMHRYTCVTSLIFSREKCPYLFTMFYVTSLVIALHLRKTKIDLDANIFH